MQAATLNVCRSCVGEISFECHNPRDQNQFESLIALLLKCQLIRFLPPRADSPKARQRLLFASVLTVFTSTAVFLNSRSICVL